MTAAAMWFVFVATALFGMWVVDRHHQYTGVLVLVEGVVFFLLLVALNASPLTP